MTNDHFDIHPRGFRGRPGRPDRARFHHGEPGQDHGHGEPGHVPASGFERGGFGPGFGHGFPPGFDPRGFGPGPRRRPKGDVRLAILSLLSENDGMNGYSIMKAIGEKTDGAWRASPGSVYPTLQQLVDEELIAPRGEGRKTEFTLTDAGREYVAANGDELAAAWSAVPRPSEASTELFESIGKLMGVVGQFRHAANDAQRKAATEKIDEARRALYLILAE
jgi:DNA-binding PadR family transcriptional regulator